jgi:hypothetical protein
MQPEQVGVALIQMPKPVADMLDHIGLPYGLTTEQTIRAIATVTVMLLQEHDARVEKFMNRVGDEAKRERESGLLLIGRSG